MTALTKNEAVIVIYRCKKGIFYLFLQKNNCNFEAYFIEIQNYCDMKRFTLLAALVLMVAMPTFAERVTSETARKVASTFLNNNGTKSVQLTDLSKEAGFPNLYIFTADKGFVIMSADDCVQPILGYSLTGRFVAENMPTNVSGWLQGYNDEIQYAIDNNMKANTETTKLWKNLMAGNSKAGKATVVVDALIQTTWDQDPGYNDLCPYDYNANQLTVTGCAATAMAQIMRYWEYPSHGVGSNSYTPSAHPEYGVQSVNFAQATYDWTAMPLHSSSAEVAKLMYHCGVSVNMDYNIAANGGSSAYNTSLVPAFKNYFNYKTTATLQWKDYYSGNWTDLLKTELNAGRPIEYNGSGSGGGHAFVCDGYDSSNYFHFNWGWSGSNDGFYSLSNLVPGSGGSGGGSYNFTQSQSAVIGIEPKDCTASTPTNFNVTIEGRNAILTWNAVANAASYSIYRDGLLIANTTNTNYTDSNLSYGTYAYYIKSRDTNGAASAPTSTITVAIEPVPTNLTVTQNGNGAVLNWSEPEWCLPSTDNEVLTYGDGSYSGRFGAGTAGSMYIYFGHKYPASMLEANKAIYKVSFYATEAGAFQLFIYTATANNSRPQTQIYNQSITASTTGWIDIVISDPIEIDPTKDLWVFIYDPEAKAYPMGFNSTVVTNGNYCSWDPYNPTTSVNTQNVLFLIRTCITDGSFFYNLYDNNTSIASNISGTSYTLSSITNNTAHQYTLKTIFNNSVTTASNMAGLTIGNASLNSLTMAANDKMTITENSKLTVSGTLSDVNADNLILENGAQLINSSTGVQATVKKNITAYTQDGGWNLLASPIESVTPTVSNGLIANNYDLYYFDQSEQLEWRNYKPNNFTIDNKICYLYANSGNPTLSLAGTLVANTTATSLDYDNNASFKGFNLIGNPYPCNTYVDRSFFVLDGNGSDFTLGSNPIPPCSAILVQAQGTGESVTFSKNASKSEPNIAIAVTKANTKDNAIIDQARVGFNEKDQLMKYTLSDRNSRLYIPQNGQDFAVAYANGENEMPINFKAAQNGTYTINIETEGLVLDYLHLIDNLTGNDVDLLATPTYTFEAKTTDYATRFRLVFNDHTTDGPSTSSGTFAYINNGNIVVNGEGVMQIVDVTGRVVVEEDAINHVSTSELTPGVYVLRLINGENVMTQKIVIE